MSFRGSSRVKEKVLCIGGGGGNNDRPVPLACSSIYGGSGDRIDSVWYILNAVRKGGAGALMIWRGN